MSTSKDESEDGMGMPLADREHNPHQLTEVVHGDYSPDRSEGAVVLPIFPTTTYVFPNCQAAKEAFIKAFSGDASGCLIYSRVNHPNAEILEGRLKALEPSATGAKVFASGMSAISTLMLTLAKRDLVIAYSDPVYGGTWQFLQEFMKDHLGFKVRGLNLSNPDQAEEQILAIGQELGILFVETPANPSMAMVDIARVAAAAKAANPDCIVVVDNTFMGTFQHCFKVSQQVDLTVYSATKFLGGHSHVLGGVIFCRAGTEPLLGRISGTRVMLGTILAVHESWLLSQDIITYELRMTKQAENAAEVAAFLNSHPKIAKVLHPSLLKPGDADYEIYMKQCNGTSSIISFWLKPVTEEEAFRFLDAATENHVILNAVSLGGTESLATHPATTTHSEMDKASQEVAGITSNLIRLSVGIENTVDLIAALQHGFDQI